MGPEGPVGATLGPGGPVGPMLGPVGATLGPVGPTLGVVGLRGPVGATGLGETVEEVGSVDGESSASPHAVTAESARVATENLRTIKKDIARKCK